MITVFLYGKLAELFGDKYRLDASSPAEACRALEANNPGRFYRALHGNKYRVVRGADLDSGEDVPEDFLTFRQAADIHFLPVVEGSKSGFFQAVLGVALITAAVFTAGTSVAGYGFMEAISAGAMGHMTIFGFTASSVALFGGAMLFGGISQMLTPTLNISGGGGVRDNVDPRKSFVFTGAENVEEQGVPVPVGYGELEVGSIVVSRSLTVESL